MTSPPPLVISQEFDAAIPIAKLREHPDNPNRGRDDVVSESIDTTGFFGGILVHKRTKHIIGGNTRFRSMKAKGATTIPGFWVTCDDATAKRIMLVDNQSAKLSDTDTELVAAILSEMDSLAGTGYTDADLEALLASFADDEPLDGSPQLQDMSYALMIDCDNETHQGELLTEFLERGLSVRPVML